MRLAYWNRLAVFVLSAILSLSPFFLCAEEHIDDNYRKNHGLHEFFTKDYNESIEWRFTWSDQSKTHYERRTFSNIDEFKKEFLKENFPKTAKLKIAGMWKNYGVFVIKNNKINELLLMFLRDNGYEENSFEFIKNLCPHGCYTVYFYFKDKKISYGKTAISDNAIDHTTNFGSSIEEFKKYFKSGKINKLARIAISYSNNYESRELSKIMYNYLKEEGYLNIEKIDSSDPDP